MPEEAVNLAVTCPLPAVYIGLVGALGTDANVIPGKAKRKSKIAKGIPLFFIPFFLKNLNSKKMTTSNIVTVKITKTIVLDIFSFTASKLFESFVFK